VPDARSRLTGMARSLDATRRDVRLASREERCRVSAVKRPQTEAPATLGSDVPVTRGALVEHFLLAWARWSSVLER
jgi:hypothetical protein